MKRASFGVIGHVDHGKTALVRALTGMETDRLSEEQRRGVSIALGFAHARIGDTEIDFIDMPGHERFVRTMVSGATGMQAALLVVAANEGIKPQTHEHVAIAVLLGIRRVVIAITKADLADPAAATAAAAALVARAGLETSSPVCVSSVTGAGLEALRKALAAAAEASEPPTDDGFAWLPIDRAFTLSGHGLVVTGTLRCGRIGKGDVLALSPGGDSVRVRGLQVHGSAVESAAPGQRVAVNLRGTNVETAGRGRALATPGQLIDARWLTVELVLPPDGPALRTGATLTLLLGTAETPVRLRLLGRNQLSGGESGLAQLHAAVPVAAPAHARFILRLPSPAGTVAGGRVLEPDARRLRRNDPLVLERLTEMAAADRTEAAALMLEQAGARGVAPLWLAQRLGVAPARLGGALGALAVERTRSGVLVRREVLEALQRRIQAAVAAAPQPLTALRRAAGAGEEVFEEAMLRLSVSGAVRVDSGVARGTAQAQAQAQSEGVLAARVAEALRRGGLSPPDLGGEVGTRETKRALERLVREHVAVRTYDKVQKREIVFHREAVEEARRRLTPHLGGEGLKVTEAGVILGISRKFSVPLLEHLDAIQFTRRAGDRRTLGPAASG